jgi:Uma2 family endonuclease
MDNLMRVSSESFKEEDKFEIINGQVVMFASPTPLHSKMVLRIGSAFEKFLKGKKCTAFTEAGITLNNYNKLIPDVSVICDKNKITENGIEGAPDFVVEVLSTSTAKYDRGDKKDIYEKNGVKEYWIVSPFGNTIEVYILNAEKKFILTNVYFYFEKETEYNKSDEFITTSLYGDDLKLSIKEIFAPIL